MKKNVVVLCVMLVLVGCSSINGSRQLTDGSTLKVSANRFMWASEGIEASTEDQEGFKFTLKVQKSNPDVEALKAVAEGVAKGAVQGAK